MSRLIKSGFPEDMLHFLRPDRLPLQRKDIPAVSYNTQFFESANDGGIGGFFLKFRKSLMSSSDRNNVFVDEVANTVDRLIYKTQEVLMMR